MSIFFKKTLIGNKTSDIQNNNISPINTIEKCIPFAYTYPDKTSLNLSEKEFNGNWLFDGSTQMGKTTANLSQIFYLLENNMPFALFEPHGKLIDDTIELLYYRYHKLIQNNRIEEANDFLSRIILIDPTNPNDTVYFNPLQIEDRIAVSQKVNTLISNIRSIYGDSSWGPRVQIMLNLIFTELALNRLPLPYAYQFVSNGSFRQRIINNSTNPLTRSALLDYESLNPSKLIEFFDSSKSRLLAILEDERVSNMFNCYESSFNFSDVFAQRQYLIVKITRESFDEHTASFYSNILLNFFISSMFQRFNNPCDNLEPYYCFIDEFPFYTRSHNESLQFLLNENSKFKCFFRLCAQQLSSLNRSTADSVINNCKTKLLYNANFNDSKTFSNEIFDPTKARIKSINPKTGEIFYKSIFEIEKINEYKISRLNPYLFYFYSQENKAVLSTIKRVVGDLIPTTNYNAPLFQILGFDSQDSFNEAIRSLNFGSCFLRPRIRFNRLPEINFDNNDNPSDSEANRANPTFNSIFGRHTYEF